MKHKILEAFLFRRRSDTDSNFYTPLDSSREEIRVIHLLPGEFDHEIKIELVPVSLSSEPPPRYNALSYVWGREQCQAPALVNGKPFAITSNLDIALRYFRDRVVKKVLWVDAVCINQGDIVEKGIQVQMMGKIYSKAAQVFVWLGQAGGGSDELIDHMSGSEALEGAVDPTLQDASLAMMGRPWFTRIWVQQEIALARLDPVVCCGRRTISFVTWCDHMLKMLLALEDTYREVMQRQEMEGVAIRPSPGDSEGVVEAKYQKLLQHIGNNKKWMAIQKSLIAAQNLAYLRAAVEMASGIYNEKLAQVNAYIKLKTDPRLLTRVPRGNSHVLTTSEVKNVLEGNRMDEVAARKFIKSLVSLNDPTEFPLLLRATYQMEATEPRDKVFGILGLAKFAGKPILADYNKTKRQVYSEAFAAVIRDGLEWSYSMWSVSGSRKKGLPSWVPDLGYDITDIPSIRPRSRAIANALQSSFRGVPLATFSNDYQTLHAGGIELGHIQVAFQQPMVEDPELANPDERFKIREEVKALIAENSIPIRTMWQTMIGTTGYSFTWGGDQLEVLRSEEMMLRAISIICGQGDIASQEGQDCLSKDDLKMVHCQLFNVCDKSTLFFTNTGRVGLVKGKVQKGDTVAALFGVGIPFILRRASSLSTVLKGLGRKGPEERGQEESYEIISTCHIGEHEWGHPEVPRDVDIAELYRSYNFQTFVIS